MKVTLKPSDREWGDDIFVTHVENPTAVGKILWRNFYDVPPARRPSCLSYFSGSNAGITAALLASVLRKADEFKGQIEGQTEAYIDLKVMQQVCEKYPDKRVYVGA